MAPLKSWAVLVYSQSRLKGDTHLLYHLHEWQQTTVAPFRLAAEANMQLFRHPMNPASYTGAGRAYAAACELFETKAQRIEWPCC